MKTNNISNNIISHKEYNIIKDKDIYNLRIEIDKQNIYFITKKLNESLDYNYKSNLSILEFINKFELNQNKYSDNFLILNLFDKINQNNNILIDIIDDNSINIIFKYRMICEDIKIEIKLQKENMNINDKLNILFNQLELINNNNINNNINYNIKGEEINNKINNQDNKIEEMNNKINNQNNNIEEMNNKINNQNNNIESINKKIDEVINNFNKEYNYKFKFIILILFIIIYII